MQRLKINILLWFVLFTPALCRAEMNSQDDNSSQLIAQEVLAEKVRSKLITKEEPKPKVVVLKASDYTEFNLAETMGNQIAEAFQQILPTPVTRANSDVGGVTLEDFRKSVNQNNAHLIVASFVRNTNVDVYLYDRTEPYYLYAYSQNVPGGIALSGEFLSQLGVVAFKKALYRYSKGQYFELPREEGSPFIQSDIPRWLASLQNVESVNREAVSQFYASLGFGAALSLGGWTNYWNSNLFSLQLGYRLNEEWFVDAEVAAFAYNAGIVSVKKLVSNKDLPYKMTFGLGAAFISSRKTLDYDTSEGIQNGTLALVPSFSMLYPVDDVYLKAEAKFFIGTGGAKILTFTPGFLVMF